MNKIKNNLLYSNIIEKVSDRIQYVNIFQNVVLSTFTGQNYELSM